MFVGFSRPASPVASARLGVSPSPMPAPRIIFLNRVYQPSTAATAQLLTDLAEGLAVKGHEVHVITSGTGDETHSGVAIHRTGTPIVTPGVVVRVWRHRHFIRAARARLRELARKDDVIVPMTDPPLLAMMAVETGRKLGARVIPWIQDIYPEIAAVHFGPIADLLLTPLLRRRDEAWRLAERCVTLGDDMAETVRGAGVPPERISILPNWAPAELEQVPDPAAVAARRQAWGVADRFVVAYSGNLGRVHEFDTALAAAERLRGEPRIVFLFIGRGPRFDEIAAKAQTRNLNNVRLLPPAARDELAVSLAAADAHLVTLQPDYSALIYPSKLAGVLAVGRPTLFIGPRDSHLATLLARGYCGASFHPGDSAGLAATARAWHLHPELAAQFGRSARSVYEREFKLGQALMRWTKILAAT